MSNNNKPTFSLPGSKTVAPPPVPLPPAPAPQFAALLAKYPLPWCVGPDGYLWVAADVEKVTDKDELNRPGVTDDGWRATGAKARLVLEHTMPADLAAFVVHCVNKGMR